MDWNHATYQCQSCSTHLAGATEHTSTPLWVDESEGCWKRTASWVVGDRGTAFLVRKISLAVFTLLQKVMSPNSYSKSVPSWALVCFSGYVQLYSPVRVLPVTGSQSASHKLHIVRETLERHPPRQISLHDSQSRLEPSMMSSRITDAWHIGIDFTMLVSFFYFY